MKYILSFGLWLFALLPTTAQQTPGSAPVQHTQQQVADLERSNRILREDLTRLQKDHADLKATLEEYKPFMENWKLILSLFGIGGLGIALLLRWDFWVNVRNKLKEEVNNSITSLLTNKRKDFLAIIEEYDHDRRVKEKHTLILLTPPGCSDTYHFDLLNKHGLTVKPFTSLQRLDEAQFEPGDVLIINDEAGHWTESEIETFIHAHPNVCFYIGKGRIKTSGEVSNRFAAANFRVQFLGNLMNTLKYN